jgi:hypothetical protein
MSTSRLPGLDDALASWREHALDRDAPLTRAQRHAIAATVAAALGDVRVARATDPDPALVAFADLATLAPWRLGAAALAPLRDAGFHDDVLVFDVIATTAFATLDSRLRVALAAMSLP